MLFSGTLVSNRIATHLWCIALIQLSDEGLEQYKIQKEAFWWWITQEMEEAGSKGSRVVNKQYFKNLMEFLKSSFADH